MCGMLVLSSQRDLPIPGNIVCADRLIKSITQNQQMRRRVHSLIIFDLMNLFSITRSTCFLFFRRWRILRKGNKLEHGRDKCCLTSNLNGLFDVTGKSELAFFIYFFFFYLLSAGQQLILGLYIHLLCFPLSFTFLFFYFFFLPSILTIFFFHFYDFMSVGCVSSACPKAAWPVFNTGG